MHRPNIDTDALFLFSAVFRTGSLTRAARECGMSIGGASRMLAKLRGLLEDELFVRTSRGLTPTPRARELLPEVASLTAGYARLFEPEVFRPAEVRRTFRILCVDNAVFTFLTPALSALFEKAPGIGVDFRPIRADFVKVLAAGEADFAVYPFVPSDERIRSLRLADDVIVFVCRRSHPLAELHGRRPLVRADFEPYRQVRVMTAPSNDPNELWAVCEADAPMVPDHVAVWSPYFLPIAQALRRTNLWGALPLQLAAKLVDLMPDLVILGRPRSATVFGPSLIWHERLDRDPASVWVRSVFASAKEPYADVAAVPIVED